MDGDAPGRDQSGPLPNGFDYSIIRRTPQLFSDVAGLQATTTSVFLGTGGAVDPVWAVSWEDDLIMTNVRSFDVKAYDNAFARLRRSGLGGRSSSLAAVSAMTQSYLSAGHADHSAGTWRLAVDAALITVWPPLVGRRRRVRHARPDVRARGADAADHDRSSV